jgi:fatty-acyl-CoA synthase
VEHNATWYGDDVALVDASVRLTWKELKSQVDQAALGLQGLKVSLGDRVACLMENRLEGAVMYFACAMVGAIFVPLNYWYRTNELTAILDELDATMLLYSERYSNLAVDAAAACVHRPTVCVPAIGLGGWQEILGNVSGPLDVVALDERAIHTILYTSGTTDRPKGVMTSHRSSYLDGIHTALGLGLQRGDCWVAYTPMFHLAALSHWRQAAMVAGKFVLLPEFEPSLVLSTLEAEQATVLFGIHTTLKALMECPDFESTDLSSIRLLIYGAYDPTRVVKIFVDCLRRKAPNLKVVHTYGSTETGRVSMLWPEMHDQKLGSVGKPYPGVALTLVDDKGTPVSNGSSGEVVVRSEALMSGYWRKDEATAEVMTTLGMRTGDLAAVDSDGFMYITGRKKDVIRTGAENVSAREVELVLLQHEAVSEVAVMGVPDTTWEERVCAVVVLASPVGADELLAFARERLAGFKAPTRLVFRSSLPKTPVGKVAKMELKASVIAELAVSDQPT